MARQPNIRFSERLREVQADRKVTTDDLARRSGVSVRLIQKYRAGTTEPRNVFGDPSANAHAIAAALKVAVADLVPPVDAAPKAAA